MSRPRKARPPAKLHAAKPAKNAEPILYQKLDDCPDCHGSETSENCLRCDGTATICGVCGEARDACPCPVQP